MQDRRFKPYTININREIDHLALKDVLSDPEFNTDFAEGLIKLIEETGNE